LPNSHSEFRHWVLVTDPGGQTCHMTLPFDATPGDDRLRQGVERVTGEWRSTGREHDDHRLVRHTLTLVGGA